MEERRQFIRFPMQMQAKYLEKSNNAWYDFFTVNISRKGMAVEIFPKKLFNRDLPFQSEMIVPPKKEPIHITSDIVWMKGVKRGSHIFGGVRFDKIDASSKFDLLDYAYNMWNKKQMKLSLKGTERLKKPSSGTKQITQHLREISAIVEDVTERSDEIFITVNGSKWNQLENVERYSLATELYKVVRSVEDEKPVALIDEGRKKLARSLKTTEKECMILIH